MNKNFILLIVILLSLPLCFADDNANVLLTLKDVNNNTDISKVIVYLTLNDKETTQYVPENDILKLKLADGNYSAIMKIDDVSTKGMDYFKKTEFSVDSNLVQGIYLFPVGSIRGIVKDKLDNVVSNAKLSIECVNSLSTIYPGFTTEFGTFNVDVPVGQCRVFASYDKAVGIKEVEISKGDLNNLEINLDKLLIVPSDKPVYSKLVIILFILILIAIVIALYFTRKKMVIVEKEEKQLEKREEQLEEIEKNIVLGKRAKDIVQTLGDKEKEIIKFLIQENGKTSQAKIHHEVGIPKASLFRYIGSLENKKIIEVKKVGKVKRMQFTAWFLGNDN